MRTKKQPIGIGMKPCRTAWGQWLRDRRLELGLSQQQVADRSGIEQTVYSHYELGKPRNPSQNVLETLAWALESEPTTLLLLVPALPAVIPPTARGRFVLARREQLGLTRADLANRLGVSRQAIIHLELGRREHFQYPQVHPLARALELDPSAFVPYLGGQLKVTTSPLGRCIRQRRMALGISARKLATILGVSAQAVSQLERVPTAQGTGRISLVKLAEVLGLCVKELEPLCPKRRASGRKPRMALSA